MPQGGSSQNSTATFSHLLLSEAAERLKDATVMEADLQGVLSGIQVARDQAKKTIDTENRELRRRLTALRNKLDTSHNPEEVVFAAQAITQEQLVFTRNLTEQLHHAHGEVEDVLASAIIQTEARQHKAILLSLDSTQQLHDSRLQQMAEMKELIHNQAALITSLQERLTKLEKEDTHTPKVTICLGAFSIWKSWLAFYRLPLHQRRDTGIQTDQFVSKKGHTEHALGRIAGIHSQIDLHYCLETISPHQLRGLDQPVVTERI